MRRNPYKPFKSIKEQINVLKNDKNILINDEEFAKDILFSTSYYTLVNGYSKEFLESTLSDKCIPNTSIDILHLLYTLDTDICSIINKNILKIEQTLKTLISYRVGEVIGDMPEDYLSQSNYSPSSYGDYNKFYKAAKISLGIRRDGSFFNPTDSSIKYYANTYGRDFIPPWILANGLTLGPTINWYNCLNTLDKNWICSAMTRHFPDSIDLESRLEFLKVSLRLLHEIRNNLSHSRRVLLINSSIEVPKNTLFKIINDEVLTEQEYNSNLGKKGLFAGIIVLYILLYDKYQLNGLHCDITNLLGICQLYNPLKNGMNILKTLELPDNLSDRLEKLYKIIYPKS